MSSQGETSEQLSGKKKPHAKFSHDIPKESIDRLHYLNYINLQNDSQERGGSNQGNQEHLSTQSIAYQGIDWAYTLSFHVSLKFFS